MFRTIYYTMILFLLSMGSFALIHQGLLQWNMDILFFIKPLNLSVFELLSIVFAWGLVGGVINSITAKWQVKKIYNLEKIKSGTVLNNMVLDINHRIAKKLNIKPAEIFLFRSEEKNAFTSGFRRNGALIAISTNLLYSLKEKELEAILLHEYGHIVSGDMLTQQILEGVIQSYILFSSKVIQLSLIRGASLSSFATIIFMGTVFEWAFMFFAKLFFLWYSRHREFKADSFAVKMQGSALHIINSLNSLCHQEETASSAILLGKKFFSIYEYKNELLSTHPNFKNRLINIEKSI